MRELEFRAWDKDKNRYPRLWTVEFGHDGIDDMLAITETNGSVTISKNFVLEQYTGRKDKHGVKTYESDIVNASIYSDEKPQKLIVQWLGSGFVIEYEDSESDLVLISEFVGSLEVIGNVHKNPELLET